MREVRGMQRREVFDSSGGKRKTWEENRWLRNGIRTNSHHLEDQSVGASISPLKENTIDHFKLQRTPCLLYY